MGWTKEILVKMDEYSLLLECGGEICISHVIPRFITEKKNFFIYSIINKIGASYYITETVFVVAKDQ